MKQEPQDISCKNKQQQVTEIKQQQDTNDSKSIKKNAAETMLVSEPPENMLFNKNVDETTLKSGSAKYTKFMGKKYVRGDLVLTGTNEGHLLVYSLSKDTIIHYYDQILNNMIWCIAKTSNNKSLYVCDWEYNFVEIDVKTCKKLNCNRLKINYLAVTDDNRFLFTATQNENGRYEIQKHSVRTNKLIDTLEGHQKQVSIMSISHDNKLLLLGYWDGSISIVNTQEWKIIKTTKILDDMITSIS